MTRHEDQSDGRRDGGRSDAARGQGRDGQGRDGQGRGQRRDGQGRGGQGRGGDRGRGGGGGGGRTPEEQAAVKLQQKLSTVLRRLPDIEREILEARMGLVDGTPMKPGQVATRLGLTIHEVKTIEARAMERIREIGPLKGLERFLGQ